MERKRKDLIICQLLVKEKRKKKRSTSQVFHAFVHNQNTHFLANLENISIYVILFQSDYHDGDGDSSDNDGDKGAN